MGGVTFGLPRPGRVVKWLLIVNVAVFVVQLFADQARPWGPMTEWLGVKWDAWWQIWRYVTFQFLHDPESFFHILFNMLGVYFLGTALEARFGARRFLVFYLVCGVVAGVAYAVIGAAAGEPGWRPIIGASGGVFGLVVAAAVYFPHFRIILLFFPVPIRLAAILIFAGMAFVIMGSLGAAMRGAPGAFGRAMSDVAHLGGALAAAVWIILSHRLVRVPSPFQKIRQGAWQRKMAQRAAEQAEIDRILHKIHTDGLSSLTRREKRLLQRATDRQREEERRVHKL